MENINSFEQLFNHYLPTTPLPMEECFELPLKPLPPPPPPPPPPPSEEGDTTDYLSFTLCENDSPASPEDTDIIDPAEYLSISMTENDSPVTVPLSFSMHPPYYQIENIKRIRYSACNFQGCCKVYKGGSSFRSLFRHQKKTHQGDSYVCHFCNKEFHCSDALSLHQASVCEHPEKVYKCHLCNKDYKDLYAYNFHNQKHEVYICPVCEIVCQTSASLKKHSRIHNNRHIGRYYTCNICSAQYLLESNLKKHQFKVHFLPFCDSVYVPGK
jgi:hypothetical protein